MKRILITGAGGFIGANLLRRLIRDGYEVHALMRTDTNIWRLENVRNQIAIHHGDLLDSAWINEEVEKIKPHVVIHLAQHGGYPFQKDNQKIFETNLFSTIHLMNAAESVGVEQFIQTGSSSEYGAKRAPMKESDLLEPNSAYAVSKAAATLYCQYRGRDAKLPVVVLRLFSVYGPWEEPGRLMPTVILRALNDQDLELSSPDIARDFIYVDDVVDAYMATMQKKIGGGIIMNVCTGQQQTLQIVADEVLKLHNGKLNITWGGIEKGRSYDTDMWVGDPSLAAQLLDWRPKTTLSNGIKKTADWLKDNQRYYEPR